MESLSQVALILLAIAVLAAWIRGGWAGVKSWIHAKFGVL
jgi:hypothetical protein